MHSYISIAQAQPLFDSIAHSNLSGLLNPAASSHFPFWLMIAAAIILAGAAVFIARVSAIDTYTSQNDSENNANQMNF